MVKKKVNMSSMDSDCIGERSLGHRAVLVLLPHRTTTLNKKLAESIQYLDTNGSMWEMRNDTPNQQTSLYTIPLVVST